MGSSSLAQITPHEYPKEMPVDDADDISNARIDRNMPMIKISEALPSSDTAQPIEEISDVVHLETAVSHSSYLSYTTPCRPSRMHPF